MSLTTKLENIGTIVLAAGTSTRLGEPKALLKLRSGDSLVRHTTRLCVQSSVGPVVVVTGASDSAIRAELEGLICMISYHADYRLGMGTSIAHGVQQLSSYQLQGYIIVLVDQPYLSTDIVRRLQSEAIANPQKIIVSKYKIGQGPPCYFPTEYSESLAALQGDVGAKSIIAEAGAEVIHVAFPHGHKDIDTPTDKKHLLRK